MPFEAWETTLRETCGHYYGVPGKGQRGVDGDFVKRRFCGLDAAEFSCNIDKIERTSEGIRRDDREHFFLLMQLSGRTNLELGDRRTVLVPGDFYLLDSVRTAAMHFEGNSVHYLSLHLPRASLLLEADRHLLTGVRLPADNEATARLSRYVHEWLRGGKEHCASPPDYLLDLTRATFAPDGMPNAAAIMRSAPSRYELAVRDIEINLCRPELSLEWIARRIGISSRQLERDFQTNATSFVRVLREKRLKLALERMEAGCRAAKEVRITEVALNCGFRDISNFNRAFRARFGCTPREYLAELQRSSMRRFSRPAGAGQKMMQ